MLATSHALVGAALATKIPNPVIGLPIIFLSHLALDALPHWDFWTNGSQKGGHREVSLGGVIDVVASFFLAWLAFSSRLDPLYLFLTVFVSQALDWLETPFVVFDFKGPLFSWPYKIQHLLHFKDQLPRGLITQIIFVIVFLWLFGIFTF